MSSRSPSVNSEPSSLTAPPWWRHPQVEIIDRPLLDGTRLKTIGYAVCAEVPFDRPNPSCIVGILATVEKIHGRTHYQAGSFAREIARNPDLLDTMDVAGITDLRRAAHRFSPARNPQPAEYPPRGMLYGAPVNHRRCPIQAAIIFGGLWPLSMRPEIVLHRPAEMPEERFGQLVARMMERRRMAQRVPFAIDVRDPEVCAEHVTEVACYVQLGETFIYTGSRWTPACMEIERSGYLTRRWEGVNHAN